MNNTDTVSIYKEQQNADRSMEVMVNGDAGDVFI